MAPTTRSASKSSADHPILPRSVTIKKVSSLKKTKKGKQVAVDNEPPRCPLLVMPPEIRNRIYDFCKERDCFNEYDVPRAIRRNGGATDLPHHPKARTFFSLTQACKLIRAEYRPLWLRKSSIRTDLEDMSDFISTFYPQRADRNDWYCNAPRLLLLSCDHEKTEYKDEDRLLDLKQMLKLRAFSPSTTVKFVIRRWVEYDLPCKRCSRCGYCICGNCENSYQIPTDRRYDPDDPWAFIDTENMYCGDDIAHEDAVDATWGKVNRDYAYLEPLNDFLANSNESWLQSIRNDFELHMTIECFMGQFSDSPMIYLRFAKHNVPSLLHTQRMYPSACSYLETMEILHPQTSPKLDFVVGVATGRYTRCSGQGTASVPLYHQTHIPGRTYKAQMQVPSLSKWNWRDRYVDWVATMDRTKR